MNIFTFLALAYASCWLMWAMAAMTVAESALTGDVPGLVGGTIKMLVHAVIISFWDR